METRSWIEKSLLTFFIHVREGGITVRFVV